MPNKTSETTLRGWHVQRPGQTGSNGEGDSIPVRFFDEIWSALSRAEISREIAARGDPTVKRSDAGGIPPSANRDRLQCAWLPPVWPGLLAQLVRPRPKGRPGAEGRPGLMRAASP